MISITVPCYNQAEFLPRCLDSLRGQTYEDVEIICVNDGSTDATGEILRAYAQKDGRIRIVDIPHGGVGRARNAGLKHANGEYLMSCDPDDEFMPNTCEKLYQAILSEDCDAALCSIEVIYDTDYQMKSSDDDYYKLKFSGLIEDNHQLLNTTDLSVCNKIFKKSLVDKFDIKFIEDRIYEDANFTWKFFAVGNKFYCLKEPLYRYYRHSDSIMNKTFAKKNKSIDHIYVVDNVYEFLVRNKLFEEYIRDFYTFYRSYVNLAKKYGNESCKKEMEDMESELQDKYDSWIRHMEGQRKIQERNRILANLRSRVKS